MSACFHKNKKSKKMKSNITFKMAAKTNMGLVRTNNEDNFQAACDLCAKQMTWVNNEVCPLGDKGALLVVADGMGGLNAGEVASQIAIDTIKEWFAADKITAEVTESRFSIERFMNDAVVAADARIKQEGREHSESRGMGTTIVIGWLLGGKLYVSWCGDSRAYVYNHATGLHQLSVDHSYVQRLVEQHKISRHDAFDYPESNIITRSLSDATPKAHPESLLKPYTLCDGDIVMLCTDGLSGMLRDGDMADIMARFAHDMDKLTDQLIAAAINAGGRDNITLGLCQIMSGGGTPDASFFDDIERRLNGETDRRGRPADAPRNKLADTVPPLGGGMWTRHKKAITATAATVAVAAAIVAAFCAGRQSSNTTAQATPAADTTASIGGSAAEETVADDQQYADDSNMPWPSDGDMPAPGKTNSQTATPPHHDTTPQAGIPPVNDAAAHSNGGKTDNDGKTDNAGSTKADLLRMETYPYTLQKNDTTWGVVAKKFHTTEKALKLLNKDVVKLEEGKVIKINKNKNL